ELAQLLLVQLLLLVRDVPALARLAEAVALDGLREDDGGGAAVLDRRLVGRVHLLRIVPAAREAADLIVAQVLHQLEQIGVLAEEVLSRAIARLHAVELIVAVRRLLHALQEEPALVALEERLPGAAPDHLDDVPARAPEPRLELLDDLPIAADRAVEPLEV